MFSDGYSTRVYAMDGSGRLPRVGEERTLVCDITRIGYPEIVLAKAWYLNSNIVTIKESYSLADERGLKLRITNLNKKHIGSYSCHIETELKTGTENFLSYSLRVQCKWRF